METTLRRLYVGGISASVTDAELSERFGRFGKVDVVDIISRKDEQGNPIKTFAYMNINISDADLKKCLSVLNKAKWKGGVLKIETAKESFLHKLEQERQVAIDQKKPKEQRHTHNDLLQSLEKAGVTDFQMKASVPGTEVPNHKNWVVSKYGRVLPVLHLKGNTQSKIMKYDPSKYCHNLKKLDNISLEPTAVSQLTWYLDGGEDDISKKRRGEFPGFKSPVKKSKVNSSFNTSKTDEKGSGIRTPQTSLQKAKNAFELQHERETFQVKSRGHKSINSMSDEEYDSEEELRAIIEREKMMTQSGRHAEDASIEVVDDSFTPSYQTHWAESMGTHRRSNSSSKDDNGYDSADTDEIITVAKTTQNCSNGKKERSSSLAKHSNVVSTNLNISKCSVKHEDEQDSRTEDDSHGSDSDTEDSSDSFSDEEYESMMQNCYRLDLSMGDLEALVNEAAKSDNTDENDSDQEYDSEDADIVIADAKCVQHDTVGDLKGSDGDQATRKKQKSKAVPARDLDPGHCSSAQPSDRSISHLEGESGSVKQDLCQVDLTVGKLKPLEKSDSKLSSNDEDQTDVSRGGEKETKTQKETKNSNDSAVAVRNLKRKKGIEPADILASILEDDDDRSIERSKRKKKKKNPPNKPPAFKGLGSLMSSLSLSNETKAPVSSCAQPTRVVTVGSETKANHATGESKGKQDSKNNGERPVKKTSTDVHQSNKRDDSGSSSSSSDESSSDADSGSATSQDCKAMDSQKSGSKEQTNSKAKQLQDNQKRLAAMEVRRKEREQQKQAIQGALLNLDSQPAKKSQHIVFNSESEEESAKDEEASTSNVHSDKTNHVKAKLFDSSGEDSDDEEEKDDKRFEIKTQYEGRSGEKLMQLQSRFGTDERFKMDARFLEDSSEGEEDTEQSQKLQTNDEDDDGLLAEKKKNLDILQSVLNVNVELQATSKKAAKAKIFKDLNALQYDPTKEDHAAFETKVEEEKKESKSERKKKQLEAEKLPEVSKETFHEVLLDFKEVFGAPRPQAMEEPETTWDQMEEPQKMDVENSMSNMDLGFQKSEGPAGFTFSFFGTSIEESVFQDEPYKIETIKTATVAWQEDPRFQDSSSEGEEEEEDAAVTTGNTSSQLEKSSGIRFFFFAKDDTRLKEGPKMFFRSSKSEEKAKYWDDMRDTIMEECKKRHRDAKRKLKYKQ